MRERAKESIAERYRRHRVEWEGLLVTMREHQPDVTPIEVTQAFDRALARRGERRVTLTELRDSA